MELGEGMCTYFSRYVPLYVLVIPVLCCEVLLAAILFAAWELVRRLRWQDAAPIHILFLLACIVPLRGAYLGFYRLAGEFLPGHAPQFLHNRYLWGLLAAAGAAFMLLRLRTLSRLALETLRYSLLLLIVIFMWAASAVLRFPPSAYADGAPAPLLRPPASAVRVVWVIFDEMSQSLAFDHRPSGVQLPNFDRLKNETFYAVGATPPSDATLTSLPSLILGTAVVKAEPKGPDAILLWKSGARQPISWRSEPNVFDSARELGFNTAVAGWYHPYGRLLNRSLTSSFWTTAWFPNGVEEPADRLSLPRVMAYRTREAAMFLVAGQKGSVATVAASRAEMSSRFNRLIARASKFAADPSIGLALLHLPVPHPPSLFSRTKGAMEVDGRTSYLDNLVLADRTLGILRDTIERAGLWDRTALLVTSDHGWRPGMWRPYPEWTAEDEAASHIDTTGIPFLLKLPAQKTGMQFGMPFNTVITRSILLEILGGRLKDVSQLPALIDELGRVPN